MPDPHDPDVYRPAPSPAHAAPDAAPSADVLHRLLIESVTDYAIFALDVRGHVVSWNAGAERLKGYAADEMIGRHFSRFYTEEDLRGGKPARALETAARTGRFEDEGWRVRKDGTRFWASVVITALRDARGGLVGFGKVTRDLTTRRAAEEQGRALAAEQAARAEAERRSEELARLTEQLHQQAVELEAQTDEAQSLAEELEQSNEEIQRSLEDAERVRDLAREAERFAAGVVASIADPFVVQDAEWRFRYVNAAAAAIFQRHGHAVSSDALIGRVVWEVYPEIVGTPFEREMRRAAAERVPVTFEAFYAEQGSWARLHCYPLPDGGLATQWQNITERKQAEESARYLARASDVLASSLDYERTLADLARLVVPELADWCAVDVMGADGAVRRLAVAHVDPAKVEMAHELNRRYPVDPRAPTGVAKVLRTGRPELHPEIPDEALAAGARDAEQLRLSRALGLRSAMIVPIPGRERTLGVLSLVSAESRRRYGAPDLALAVELGRRAGLAVDRAELFAAERAARAAAEEANRAKSQFLATMSHELRTPLNAIAGYAQLMEMGIHGPLTAAQRDALQRIQRSEQHLLALIDDVLNYARVEAGRLTLEIGEVRLRDLVLHLEPMVTPQLRARDLTLDVEPCDGALAARADAERVRQILLNLLSNAIKFSPAGARVTVACGADGDRVRIVVRDAGPGIPADKMEAIFEAFVQLGRSLTTPREGAGLGLAISRELARAMGGDLSVESTLGSGSAFTLVLPKG